MKQQQIGMMLPFLWSNVTYLLLLLLFTVCMHKSFEIIKINLAL